MSQTIGNAAKDNKSDNWRPNEDSATVYGKDVTDSVPLGREGEPFTKIVLSACC